MRSKYVLLPVQKVEEVRAAVKTGVVEMMSAGKLQPSSINVYLRAINAFMRWGGDEETLQAAESRAFNF